MSTPAPGTGSSKIAHGEDDLTVSGIAFGAWAIGGWYWGGTDDEVAVCALRTALDVGMTTIDTAPVYGFGHSEEVVGRAIAGRREEAQLLTKVGLRGDAGAGPVSFETAGPDGRPVQVRRNARPESVRVEVERSLRRLGVERIDLVQVHWPDPETPIPETMGALAELRTEGKLGAIGVSNYSAAEMAQAAQALGDVPLMSNQVKYSLVAREIEGETLPWAREHGVGVLAYSPLDQGLLTGCVDEERVFPADDGRNKRPTFRPENRAAINAALRRAVGPVAEAHGATLAQTVLAWTLAQAGISSVLAGARTPEQVLENAGAGELNLAPEELGSIDEAFSSLELDLTPAPRARGLLGRVLRRLRP